MQVSRKVESNRVRKIVIKNQNNLKRDKPIKLVLKSKKITGGLSSESLGF